MIKSPCYKCEKRHKNCHSKCEDYADYRKQLQALKPEQKDDIYSSYLCNAIYRRRKIKNEKNRT